MFSAVQRSTTALLNNQGVINMLRNATAQATPASAAVPDQPVAHALPQLPMLPYMAIGAALLQSYFPGKPLKQPQLPVRQINNPSAPDSDTYIPQPEKASPAPLNIVQPTHLKLVQPRHKLMSYNAENFVTTSKGKSVKSAASIQALSEAIRKEDPEVIALQEVGDKKLLEDFNKNYLRNQYPNIICMASSDPSRIRVAMMSKANMKVLDTKSHLKEMNEGAKYFNKRDFLETTFKTDTGFKFTVYNAHCKSMRGGEALTAPIRTQEARNAAKILKAHFAKDPKAPVFVTGDFNTLHDTPLGKPVIDILTHLDGSAKRKPMLTEVMMKDGKTDPTHSGRGVYPNTKLDYIFASRSMTPQIRKAYVAGDFTQAPWNIASDHLPYVTEFEELPPGGARAKRNNADGPTAQPAEKSRRLLAHL